MHNLAKPLNLHLTADHQLERSRWYGPNLITFLTTAEETGGAFTLIKHKLRQGFEPPLHVHTREDESHLLLEGEVAYEIGDQRIHAHAGDYVQMPRGIPHKFRLMSPTATVLLVITPSGFEEMFMEFSRPALSLELPPVPTGKPEPAFFERMAKKNAELGVTMLPEL